jgi:hypothetical protein
MFLLYQQLYTVNRSKTNTVVIPEYTFRKLTFIILFFYFSSLATEAVDINNAPPTKAGDDSARAANVGIISAHMTKVGDVSASAANNSNLAATVGGFHITSVDVARARRQHRTETGSMGTQTGSASIQSGNDVLHHQPFVPPEGHSGNYEGLQGKDSLPHERSRRPMKVVFANLFRIPPALEDHPLPSPSNL